MSAPTAMPSLEDLFATLLSARSAPDMDRAYRGVIGHPDCTPTAIAHFFTHQEPPSLPLEPFNDLYSPEESPVSRGLQADKGTWKHTCDRLFGDMVRRGGTYALALKVWEHPNFRNHMHEYGRPPETRLLAAPFNLLSVDAQLDAVEERIKKCGAEKSPDGGNFGRSSLLSELVRWLKLPKDSDAEHLRRIMNLAFSREFHNPEEDKMAFLTGIRYFRLALNSPISSNRQ